jgi:hypothetical protein
VVLYNLKDRRALSRMNHRSAVGILKLVRLAVVLIDVELASTLRSAVRILKLDVDEPVCFVVQVHQSFDPPWGY